MKPSIRRQTSLIFIGLMVGTLLLCLLMSRLFLGDYYMSSKKKVIVDAYRTIKQAADNDSFEAADIIEELDAICSNNNIIAFVMDESSRRRYVSPNGGDVLDRKLVGYIFGFIPISEDRLEEGEDYMILRTSEGRDEYLEMIGRLDEDVSFIMQTPMESIKESAALANRFFFYVGCIGSLAGAIIIWLFTRRLTGPILQLNDVSKRMVDLDFEAKYRAKARNELDLLGENMNKLSESLERSIGELKTANNELRRDIKQKEEIEEARKEFLSNVSHELKTPIALISGYAEGLKEGISDDPESRNFYCEVIMDEADKMNQMVKQLLSLDQLESGRDPVTMERFDMAALARGCVQAQSIMTEKKGIEVRLHDEEPVYVWADEYRTELVFRNYLSNAINYCSGKKVIDIVLKDLEDRVRVQVFNTGDPIPEEALDKLWDKFYKVDKARTREYGGSGIGLSIVKAVMESMHRDYGVENYTNGVMFWFELEKGNA